jgi:16S rRNA processing protein RimM
MNDSKKVLVATIGAAHSIKGEVRLNSYCDPKEQIAKYKPLFNSEDIEFVIQRIRPQGNVLVCKFENIDNRNQAEELNGKELFTYRSNFEEITSEEEFYIEDLKGLDVINDNGDNIGKVLDVINYGAGDILEIEFTDKTKEMLPFMTEIFPKIDLSNKTILCKI